MRTGRVPGDVSIGPETVEVTLARLAAGSSAAPATGTTMEIRPSWLSRLLLPSCVLVVSGLIIANSISAGSLAGVMVGVLFGVMAVVGFVRDQRARVVLSPEGLSWRGLRRESSVSWSEVRGCATPEDEGGQHVHLLLTDGTQVEIPGFSSMRLDQRPGRRLVHLVDQIESWRKRYGPE